jgi:hypothetical protein
MSGAMGAGITIGFLHAGQAARLPANSLLNRRGFLQCTHPKAIIIYKHP